MHDEITGKGYDYHQIKEVAEVIRKGQWQMREVNEVLPRRTLGVRRGEGSFLFVDLEPDGKRTLSLWVYMCDWTLIQGGSELASSDLAKEVDFSGLSLGEMLAVELERKTGRVHISFSADAKLVLFNDDAFYSSEEDYYMLFVGDHWVAKYSEQDGFSVKWQ